MTQLFPDIDLSRFAQGAAQNGSGELPAGEPVGVMAGLNGSLLALLANFSPGDLGVCIVDEKLQLSLAIPYWSEWSWLETGVTGDQTAGSSANVVVYAIPADERATLLAVRVDRTSGDNTITELSVDFPDAYSGGGGSSFMPIMDPDVSAPTVHWPDLHPDVSSYVAPPILLEPTTSIRFQMGGAGVAATEWAYKILMLRTKIVRAIVP